MSKSNSRERMLAALEHRETNYIPCNIMLLRPDLQAKWNGQFGAIEKQLELGLDPKIELPELPHRFHPDVKVKVWKQNTSQGDLLHKEYDTPAGKLSCIVNKTEDWPYGDAVPFLDDWLTPRCRKFLIEKEQDLKPLQYLLCAPTADDIALFRAQAKTYKKFGADKGLLISGGWTRYITNKGLLDSVSGTAGGDMLYWICGVENSIMMALDEPETLEKLLQIICQWNMRRMEIYLEEGLDLLVRRAYYESTDVWSPALYKKFFLPNLKKEVALTHQAGAKLAYLMTSGILPLADHLLDADIDALIGVDPRQGRANDQKTLKEKLGDRICLIGGVNRGLTMEQGTAQDVEKEVERSISILAPDGGFILSPVDGVGSIAEPVWSNLHTMIKTWKRMLSEICVAS